MIKVIIADDEENVCRLICRLVDWDSLGMEIAGVAHNGVETLDLVKMVQPDLIITDIRMPGYDGLEMIRRAIGIKPNLDFIIISGYNHFEYAQNAIKYGVSDYLLKPIKKEDFLAALNKMRKKYLKHSSDEQLKDKMNHDVKKLRTNLFTDILLKNRDYENNLLLEKINEEYHFTFSNGLFQVCAAKIDCGYEDEYENTIPILQEKVKWILESGLKDHCFDLECYLDDSTVYCLFNYSLDAGKVLRKRLKEVFDELMVQKITFQQHEFTIAAGAVTEDVNKLQNIFQSAKQTISQRLLLGTARLIEEPSIRMQPQKVGLLLAELNRRMGAAIEVLKKEAVLDCISHLKEQVSLENLSGLEIESIAAQACEIYLNHLRNNQIPFQHGRDFYEKFCIHAGRCGRIDQLFAYLSVTIGKSMDEIIEDKKLEDTRPIRLAKEYIQKNHMKPITLEEVSGYVGFNPTYFSTLFKKESGGNFVNYLSEVRMNHAKDLLRETNLTVAAICEQVGYSDLKNFTKNFTKTVGVKPNEYRKIYS